MYLIWNNKIPSMVSIVDRLDFFFPEKKAFNRNSICFCFINRRPVCMQIENVCRTLTTYETAKSSLTLASNFRWIDKLGEFPWEMVTYSEYQEDNGGRTSLIFIMLAKSRQKLFFKKENNVKRFTSAHGSQVPAYRWLDPLLWS